MMILPIFVLTNWTYIQLMKCLQLSDLKDVKVRINLKRIIDENGIIKNQIIVNSLHEVHFTLQLYTNGRPLGMPQVSNFFIPKNLFDQSIIFNYLYQDLSPDAKIAISIWSSAKKYNPTKPLGSTVIQLFDDKGQLRQGKYHLFIWPDVAPDVEDPSSTPGLANDENIEMLNFISERLQECQKNLDQVTFRAEEALKFRLSYIYRLIPAAFLQIQFPKLGEPVFYNDKICTVSSMLCRMTSRSLDELGSYLEIYDYDFQAELNNPLEDMYYTLKSQKETSSQKLIPSREEMKKIDKLASNTVKIQVKPAEKQIFLKFRHYLVQDKKYLAYLLTSLTQQYNDENQLQRLLVKWEKIDIADALHFLSKQFSLNPIYNKKKLALPILKLIRDYAVSIIAQLKDQQLTYYLLFLVQALRYEGESLRSNLLDLLNERASANHQIASLLYWYLKTESDSIKNKDTKVSKETQRNIKLYQEHFNGFLKHIRDKIQIKTMLQKQHHLFDILKKIAKSVKQAKDKKLQLKKKLVEIDWSYYEGIPYPMDVNIILKEAIPQQCTVFSSAMAPCKLTFMTTDNLKFTFLFKSGDDLRQDQMVLQMFFLMDRLLKGVNQDYRLTPYKALACSRSDGFVQFVPQTRTFQQTNLKEYLSKLIEYNSNTVMENYVYSCAGYCAITYFFGIGDRHLENLLIDSSGKMLHIDFGFILGRDPKPYPPPIKIRKDMIDAMGGIEHENFKIFKAKCLQAFLYLRKHSKIVYNLVFLMMDSGLKDVHTEGISKLYDKFLVEMNDTDAQKHFLMVLEECKNAIAALLADKIHRWASHFR